MMKQKIIIIILLVMCLNFICGCNYSNKNATVYTVQDTKNYSLGKHMGKITEDGSDIRMLNIEHIENSQPIKIKLTNIDTISNDTSINEYVLEYIHNILDFDLNGNDIYFLTLHSLNKTSIDSDYGVEPIISLENHLFKRIIYSNGGIFLIGEDKVELYELIDNGAEYICSFKLANVVDAIWEENKCHFLTRGNYTSQLFQYDINQPEYPKYAKTYRKYIHNIQYYDKDLYYLMDFKIFKCIFLEKGSDNKNNKDEEVINLISEYGYEQNKEKQIIWGKFFIISDSKYAISYEKYNKAYIDIITLKKVKKDYIDIMLNYSSQTDILADGMFQNKNPLFTVNKTVFENSDLYREKLSTMIMSGNSPDIFALEQYMIPYYTSKNLLLPLDELFSDETHNMPIFKTAEINGNIYGYPKIACIDGILVNENVLEKEWDILNGGTISIYDLLKEAQKPVLKTNNKILPNVYWYWFFMQYAMQQCPSSNLINEELGEINMNADKFSQFLTNIKQIYNSELIDENIIHNNSLINEAQKVLLYPYTLYTMRDFHILDGDYRFLPLSLSDEQHDEYGINYVEVLVVSSQSEKQEISKEYIKIFDTIPSVQNIINKANVEIYMKETGFNEEKKKLVRNILNKCHPYPGYVFHPDYQRVFEKNIEEYLKNNISIKKAIDEIYRQILFITSE